MFRWWLAKPEEGVTLKNMRSLDDPPETPAPLFAVRALKSAIFGPEELVDETVLATQKGGSRRAGQTKSLLSNKNASPMKPSGILLTPGMASGRRKTVSFGSGSHYNNPSRPADPKESDPFGSSGRKTSFIKVLEASREKPKRSTSAATFDELGCKTIPKAEKQQDEELNLSKPILENRIRPGTSDSASTTDFQKDEEEEEALANVTLDVNEPHSRSGKYWKTEFEKYHGDAKLEMTKLVRYKKLAKSYAKKKDEEALALSELLKEEQRKVAQMLAGSSIRAHIDPRSDDAGSDKELVVTRDLARQTARATLYENELKELRAFLEDQQALGLEADSSRKDVASTTEGAKQGSGGNTKSIEMMASLGTEVKALKRTLAMTEREALKLRRVTDQLTQELRQANTRHEKHLEKCEQRKQVAHEERQSLEKRCDELKQLAKSQRHDTVQLLRKEHDQMMELRNEKVSSMPVSSWQRGPKDMPRIADRNAKNDQNCAEDIVSPKSRVNESTQVEETRHPNLMDTPISFGYNAAACTSEVPITSQSRASKPVSGSLLTHAPRSILAEITNNRSQDGSPTQIESLPDRGQLTKRALDMRRENLILYAPRFEDPLPYPNLVRNTVDRKHRSSPQYSINVNSSPSKLETGRSRLIDDGSPSKSARSRHDSLDVEVKPSSLTSGGSRKRSPLPPNRLAAAKARVEQRMAEKRKKTSAVG